MWDNPSQFSSEGGSLYTFLDSAMTGSAQPEPTSENTIKSKTTSNSDVASRMEAMTQQREKEFGGISRK
jgi:hypothetical protein